LIFPSQDLAIANGVVNHLLWCFALWVIFHVDALPGRRANRWLILAGFFATILNACYLLVKYRFILNASQIQAIPIRIGFFNTDTNSLTQSALVTIVIFMVRSLFVYAFFPCRFISVVGAVGLIIETTESTPVLDSKISARPLHRSQMAVISSLERMASRLKRVKCYQAALAHNPRASVEIQTDGLLDFISHSNDYRYLSSSSYVDTTVCTQFTRFAHICLQVFQLV
jgi:hypothetical protein